MYVPLAIEHPTFQCPKYIKERHVLNNPISMEEALSETNTDVIYNFYNAVRFTNLL